MAKAKKRVPPRKKSSKRGKASAKPARKKAAKRTTPKKAKSKVRRAGRGAPKPAPKKKRPLKSAAQGTKKSAKTSGGGASRGHDHRCDRGAGPWRCCRYGVRIDSDSDPYFVRP